MLNVLKSALDDIWRLLELRLLKGLQKDIKKYEKKAAKLLERAKKYDQYADVLRGAFEEAFDEYRRKYYK